MPVYFNVMEHTKNCIDEYMKNSNIDFRYESFRFLENTKKKKRGTNEEYWEIVPHKHKLYYISIDLQDIENKNFPDIEKFMYDKIPENFEAGMNVLVKQKIPKESFFQPQLNKELKKILSNMKNQSSKLELLIQYSSNVPVISNNLVQNFKIKNKNKNKNNLISIRSFIRMLPFTYNENVDNYRDKYLFTYHRNKYSSVFAIPETYKKEFIDYHFYFKNMGSNSQIARTIETSQHMFPVKILELNLGKFEVVNFF